MLYFFLLYFACFIFRVAFFLSYFCVLRVLCVNRTPVRVVYLNHEVVVLQPRSVNTTHLGSVTIVTTFILTSPAPLVLTVSGYLCYLLLLPPPHNNIFFIIIPLCSTRYPPPLPAQNSVHLNVSHSCHPPASAACLYAPRHMPASAAISHVHSPPLFCPWPAPRSLSSPGGFACSGDLCFPCVSASHYLYVSPTPGIFLCFIMLYFLVLYILCVGLK